MKEIKTNITLFSALLIAAIFATSCSDEATPINNDNNVVQIATQINSATDWNPLSRGTGDESDKISFVSGDKIGVFAYYLPNGVTAITGEPDFMYNQEMTFNGTDWIYSPIKYWPNNQGDQLAFWAYYPYGVDRLTYSINPETKLPNLIIDGCYGTDVLVADLISESKSAIDNKVTLSFRHIMAKLCVQIEVPDFLDKDIPPVTVEVKEIWHHEFANYGTFVGFDNDGTPQWVDVSDKMVSISDKKNYTINTGETIILDEITTYYPPSIVDNITLVYRILDSEGNIIKDYPSGYGEVIIPVGKGFEIKAGQETTLTIRMNIYGIDNVETSTRPIAEWRETTNTGTLKF